ncbi:hypothetical protein MMC06_003965 [Schaereria dolodes]|nr:hypothetical protein [Schaereria dolodes]
MNWTGGRLQQSKHKGTIITAKQKDWFAKARARLQNPHTTASPMTISIFEGLDQCLGASRSNERCPEAEKQDDCKRRRMEGFEKTSPLAHQPEHIKPRRQLHEAGTSPLLMSKRSKHISQVTTATPSTSYRQAQRNSSLRNRTWTEQPHHSPFQSRTRELGAPLGKSSSTTEDMLEEKRQELIRRPDWLNLNALKPLKMDFPSIGDRDRIGKRRKLNEADIIRCQNFPLKPITGNMRGLAEYNRRRSPLYGKVDQNVSIRIGSSIHGSERTYFQHPDPNEDYRSEVSNHRSSKRSHHSTLSNEMLLDISDEDPSPIHLINDLRHTTQPESSPQANSESDTSVNVVRKNTPCPSLPKITKNIPSLLMKHKDSDMLTGFLTEAVLRCNLLQHHEGSVGSNQSTMGLNSRSTPAPFWASTRDFQDASDERVTRSTDSVLAQASECSSHRADDPNEEMWQQFINIPASSSSRAVVQDSLLAAEADIENISIAENHTFVADENDSMNEGHARERGRTRVPLAPAIFQSQVPLKPLGDKKIGTSVGLSQDEEKTKTEEDPDSAWFNFIFGFRNKENLVEMKRCSSPTTASDNGQRQIESSMEEHASTASAVTPLPFVPNDVAQSLAVEVDTSPDPLALSLSPCTLGHRSNPMPSKMVFKKPLPFVSRRPAGPTFIGIHQNRSPLQTDNHHKRRTKRKARRRVPSVPQQLTRDTEDEEIED